MTLQECINDIFSINVPRKHVKPRSYQITWPCGATWSFDRHDLEIPQYRDGKQTGLCHCFDSVREAQAALEQMGCKVELESEA